MQWLQRGFWIAKAGQNQTVGIGGQKSVHKLSSQTQYRQRRRMRRRRRRCQACINANDGHTRY